MLQDELVTYEVAKLAKEKGFNEPTYDYFINGDKNRTGQSKHIYWHNEVCEDIAIPTQALLQRWLREKKFIDIEIYPIFINGVRVYTACMYAPNLNKPKKFNYFDTYELALEDGLKYALENLI